VSECGQTSSVVPSSPSPSCPHPIQPPSRAPPMSQALGTPTPAHALVFLRVASPFLAVRFLSLYLSLSVTQSSPRADSGVPQSPTVPLSFSLRFCLRYRRGNLGSPWHRGYLLTPIRPRDRTYRPPLPIDPTTSTSIISTTTIATTTIVYYYHTSVAVVSPVPPLVLCHHCMSSIRGRPR